ncbi:MAG: thioredoxin [Gammaproteobacteria bacterium]|mgnify:CR=1 FL=1|nr:MAG: thioredoxin [Gammaproteobacteria bacterium]
MADSPHLVAVTAQNFRQVVIEGSYERPVLVDFWADWCAPCRALMPVLAKLAEEYRGRLLVAKLNTEEEQALAAQMGIRSLPTVQLYRDGRPVDQFMGALPEAQVRAFLEPYLPRESDGLLEQIGDRLMVGDLAGAQAALDLARAKEPDNPRLFLVQVQIQAASGDTQGAETLLERVPLELAKDPEVLALRGQLRFANLAAGAPSEDELAARLAANPKDSEASFLLAARQAATGDFATALASLLALLKRDRAYGDDAARKTMLLIFDLLGGEDPLVTAYRGKMLSALY